MPRSQQVIEDAKERDGNTCQKCGYKGSNKSRVEGHHIIPLGFNGPDNVDNVSTLCNHCHRYAPDDFLTREWYARVFSDYISTGVRPEVDFLYFGSRIMALEADDIGEDLQQQESAIQVPEQLMEAFQLALQIQRELPEANEFITPGYYWLVFAEGAEYGCLPEADKLTEADIENYL